MHIPIVTQQVLSFYVCLPHQMLNASMSHVLKCPMYLCHKKRVLYLYTQILIYTQLCLQICISTFHNPVCRTPVPQLLFFYHQTPCKDCPEVTLCGSQDIKIQLLTLQGARAANALCNPPRNWERKGRETFCFYFLTQSATTTRT